MNQVKTGIAIASAAAAMFTLGTTATVAQAADASMTVKCAGINSCKGHAECKTAKNDCKGMNACKGQGWVSKASEKECTAAGGKVIK